MYPKINEHWVSSQKNTKINGPPLEWQYDFLQTAKLFALAASSHCCCHAEDAGLFETSHRHNYKPLDFMKWGEAKFRPRPINSEHF